MSAAPDIFISLPDTPEAFAPLALATSFLMFVATAEPTLAVSSTPALDPFTVFYEVAAAVAPAFAATAPFAFISCDTPLALVVPFIWTSYFEAPVIWAPLTPVDPILADTAFAYAALIVVAS